MTPTPFLTDLDSRAAISGSRDPLGLVPVWSRFGRQVVGNLTTVSNSARGFTTLLLGYYFAEEVELRHGQEAESILDLFLKFEQLAAHSRLHADPSDRGFRGQERTARNLANGPRVTLGADVEYQILGNQRTYGLYGLFSGPARTSGLLVPKQPVLTPEARDFVQKTYITRLNAAGLKGGRPVTDLLGRKLPVVHLAGKHAPIAKAVAGLLSRGFSAVERDFYGYHLVHGGDQDVTHGSQPRLAQPIGEVDESGEFWMGELREVIKKARKLKDGSVLAEQLEDIRALETLVIPMSNVFGFLLSRDRQTTKKTAQEIRSTWGSSLGHVDAAAIEALVPKITKAFQDRATPAQRFAQLATAFKSGDYEAAITLLLEHNREVMDARDGSQPWVRLERGKLDVRYRDETESLWPRERLQDGWRSTYFINSLKNVIMQLRES